MQRTDSADERSYSDRQLSARQLIFIVMAIVSVCGVIPAPLALLLGLVIAQLTGHPWPHLNHKATQWLLQASVVGLGFGMNAYAALEAGRTGFGLTIVSIILTLGAGMLLGKWLKVDGRTACLIAAGTAICGGSAIAAVGPAIGAKEKQLTVALGTVFILNTVALFLFPVVGHALALTQQQFGLWSAVAIHDTSSVVGAGSRYGQEALEVATTVKLARALWIIPVSLLASIAFKQKGRKLNIPWFIGLFLLAMLANTFIPAIYPVSSVLTSISKCGLTLTLFLIGAGLSGEVLRKVGIRPMVQGTITWVMIATLTLLFIIHFG